MSVVQQPADLEKCTDRLSHECIPAAKPVVSSYSAVQQQAAVPVPLQPALVADGSQPVEGQPNLTRSGRVSRPPEGFSQLFAEGVKTVLLSLVNPCNQELAQTVLKNWLNT